MHNENENEAHEVSYQQLWATTLFEHIENSSATIPEKQQIHDICNVFISEYHSNDSITEKKLKEEWGIDPGEL